MPASRTGTYSLRSHPAEIRSASLMRWCSSITWRKRSLELRDLGVEIAPTTPIFTYDGVGRKTHSQGTASTPWIKFVDQDRFIPKPVLPGGCPCPLEAATPRRLPFRSAWPLSNDWPGTPVRAQLPGTYQRLLADLRQTMPDPESSEPQRLGCQLAWLPELLERLADVGLEELGDPLRALFSSGALADTTSSIGSDPETCLVRRKRRFE